MATFVSVAKAGDIPEGELAAFDIGGVRVAITQTRGTYYAFGDTCTHKQCSLAEGDVDGTTVTCPCHGSQFDVTTGAVRRGPARDPVTSYPVRVEGDAVQVEVG